ncbi:MAG: ABC transporter ATP-binding protein [Armatimonadota bacterium]
MSCVLDVRDLGFAYDKNPILADVSFRVDEGEFVSIIGPNGAGKSTLIKCLNRVLTGWTGEITLFGAPVYKLSQRRLATLIGYVPQPGGRSLPFTVEEFVLMGRYPYLSPFTLISREDRTIVEKTLREVGIDQFATRDIDSLSGGEKQMAFVAAALVQGAKLLLLDEPTAFLDYKHHVECSELLKRMHKDRGVTVIAVTHDINQAIALSNRVLALKHGSICFDGDSNKLISDGILEAIYETRFTAYSAECSDLLMLAPSGGGR